MKLRASKITILSIEQEKYLLVYLNAEKVIELSKAITNNTALRKGKYSGNTVIKQELITVLPQKL